MFAYVPLYEGFGLPPLEAMACGTATIVADFGAMKEVCGKASFGVDVANVNQLGEAIGCLISDNSLRERLANLGLAHSRQFSWDKTATETRILLGDLQ